MNEATEVDIPSSQLMLLQKFAIANKLTMELSRRFHNSAATELSRIFYGLSKHIHYVMHLLAVRQSL